MIPRVVFACTLAVGLGALGCQGPAPNTPKPKASKGASPAGPSPSPGTASPTPTPAGATPTPAAGSPKPSAGPTPGPTGTPTASATATPGVPVPSVAPAPAGLGYVASFDFGPLHEGGPDGLQALTTMIEGKPYLVIPDGDRLVLVGTDDRIGTIDLKAAGSSTTAVTEIQGKLCITDFSGSKLYLIEKKLVAPKIETVAIQGSLSFTIGLLPVKKGGKDQLLVVGWNDLNLIDPASGTVTPYGGKKDDKAAITAKVPLASAKFRRLNAAAVHGTDVLLSDGDLGEGWGYVLKLDLNADTVEPLIGVPAKTGGTGWANGTLAQARCYVAPALYVDGDRVLLAEGNAGTIRAADLAGGQVKSFFNTETQATDGASMLNNPHGAFAFNGAVYVVAAQRLGKYTPGASAPAPLPTSAPGANPTPTPDPNNTPHPAPPLTNWAAQQAITLPAAPGGLGFDGAGNAWIGIGSARTVLHYGPQGTLLGSGTLPADGRNVPGAVTVDASGTVWIAGGQAPSDGVLGQSYSSKLFKLPNAGGQATVLEAGGPPLAMAATPGGTLWLDYLGGPYYGLVSPAGVVSKTADIAQEASGFFGVANLLADSAGNVYAIPAYGTQLSRYDQGGTLKGSVPVQGNLGAGGIAPGGNPWVVVESQAGGATPTDTVQEVLPSDALGRHFDVPFSPRGLSVGPDGDLWLLRPTNDDEKGVVSRYGPDGTLKASYQLEQGAGGAIDPVAGNFWASAKGKTATVYRP